MGRKVLRHITTRGFFVEKESSRNKSNASEALKKLVAQVDYYLNDPNLIDQKDIETAKEEIRNLGRKTGYFFTDLDYPNR